MKTIKEQIEEKAKEYFYQIKKDYPQEIVDRNSVTTDFREGANFGISLAQRWIDVSERLPEDGEPVLISEDGGETFHPAFGNCRIDTEVIWYFYKTVRRANVTHWRPIDITVE